MPKPVLTLLDLSFPLAFSDLGADALEKEFILNNIHISQEAICSFLEDYNKQIELLKEEMNDATHGVDNIRNDIIALAQRYQCTCSHQNFLPCCNACQYLTCLILDG